MMKAKVLKNKETGEYIAYIDESGNIFTSDLPKLFSEYFSLTELEIYLGFPLTDYELIEVELKET